jgi:hypothetical protein
MHIKLSRRTLRWVGISLGVVITLIALYALGDYLTPRDAAGRPLIYSPSVRSAERYRRHCLRWLDDLAAIDARIETLLSNGDVTDPARLYDLSKEAEHLVTETSGLAQEAAFTPAPPALVGLKHLAQEATGAYVEAAQSAAVWVGTPEEEQADHAKIKLEIARERRAALKSSRWLQGDKINATHTR